MEDECGTREELKIRYERMLKMEEIMWKQKSMVRWLKNGDTNFFFSNKMAMCQNIINDIRRLKAGDTFVEGDTSPLSSLISSLRLIT